MIPIDATHRDICKYETPSDPLYMPVLAEIKRCVDKCSSTNKLRKTTSSLQVKVGRLRPMRLFRRS